MVTVFRLQQKRFLKDAYSGHGANLKPGRWNKRGHDAIYTSCSRSLCAIEVLARMNPEDAPEFYCVPAKIPKEVFDRRKIFHQKDLPDKWRSYPPLPTLQHMGARWLEECETVVLEVPSAIIPEELNFILNPRHHDFQKIEPTEPEPFTFDMRLLIS